MEFILPLIVIDSNHYLGPFCTMLVILLRAVLRLVDKSYVLCMYSMRNDSQSSHWRIVILVRTLYDVINTDTRAQITCAHTRAYMTLTELSTGATSLPHVNPESRTTG